ncbi:MAG: M67 family metallopeptidase [Chloroflexota bacterium]
MTLEIPLHILNQIHNHGESRYPEEGAGLLLGISDGELRMVTAILALPNIREEGARQNRYLIDPHDMLRAEKDAREQGLEVLGVFHSHPDHPNLPSEYDLQQAWPWLSYLITSVQAGHAVGSRAWRLIEESSQFVAEPIQVFDAMDE